MTDAPGSECLPACVWSLDRSLRLQETRSHGVPVRGVPVGPGRPAQEQPLTPVSHCAADGQFRLPARGMQRPCSLREVMSGTPRECPGRARTGCPWAPAGPPPAAPGPELGLSPRPSSRPCVPPVRPSQAQAPSGPWSDPERSSSLRAWNLSVMAVLCPCPLTCHLPPLWSASADGPSLLRGSTFLLLCMIGPFY